MPPVSTASRSPSPLPSRSLGKLAADVAGAEATVHHVLRRPIAERNESPVTVLEPAEPTMVRLLMRPPQVLMPSRLSMRSALRVPVVGYALSILLIDSEVVHRLELPDGTLS